MLATRQLYHESRFSPIIISHAVWLYHRFTLSFRDIEDLLAERGIIVSYESIRQWCLKFGPEYARKLRKLQGLLRDMWFMDEVFITINGVSLTVNALPSEGQCQVGIIPFTWEHTNLGTLKPGDPVNLEGDLIGKYVAKLLSAWKGGEISKLRGLEALGYGGTSE